MNGEGSLFKRLKDSEIAVRRHESGVGRRGPGEEAELLAGVFEIWGPAWLNPVKRKQT
jgi:hypothetical protein